MGLGGSSDAPTLGAWGKRTGPGLLTVCEQSPEIGAMGYTGVASESAPSEGGDGWWEESPVWETPWSEGGNKICALGEPPT